MLTAADFNEIQNAITEVRDDNSQTIVIRRGDTFLPPQTVRIERKASQPQAKDSEGGEEMRARVVVLGEPNLDIRTGDRFNDSEGALYRVAFVRPNRQVSCQAEAEVIG